MIQTILTRCLTGYSLHSQHYSQFFRLSSIAVRKDKLSHPCSYILPRKYFGQKSHSTYSAGNGSDSRWEDKSNAWYASKPVRILVGALGTVAVLGLGTVFSESQEEKPCDSETVDAAIKTPVENQEVGKDVVGAQRRHDGATATRLHTEPSDSKDLTCTVAPNAHEETVRKARQILRRYAEEVGAPGLVVGVTVNGRQVWADGLGFADLENGVRCSPATVMRIASISKAITMTAVAKLWEEGKLDLDVPIQKYIPGFPTKTYNGEEVTITTRQLLSHKSGIRHYKLKDPKEEKEKKKSNAGNDGSKIQSQITNNTGTEASISSSSSDETSVRTGSLKDEKKASIESKTDTDKEKVVVTSSSENESTSVCKESKNENKRCLCCNRPLRRRKTKKKKKEEEEDEFDMEEYFIKEEYETVQDALKLFQNDELFFKPGEGFLYTTHGWTVVSAVVEAAAQKPFTEVAKRLFYELGLNTTYLDVASPIIYNRASYYVRDKHGRLKNAPYVDNSYKWAGGGFLSTVGDLCKFGNAMLYASQQECSGDKGDTTQLPGYLKASTIQQLWTPLDGTRKGWLDQGYGMGWQAVQDKQSCQFCHDSRYHAYHSGAAVGASSILLVLPSKEPSSTPPQGVVVALITNMQNVGLYKVALQIAELFEESQ